MKRRTGYRQKTPDVVVDEWQATLDIKTLRAATDSSLHDAIRKGRRQATHIYIDLFDLGGADADACAAFLDAALRSYPGEVEWVLVQGPGWQLRR